MTNAIKNYGYHPMNDNHVPSYFLFNLNGDLHVQGWSGRWGLQVFTQVNNVFNKKPPFAVGGGAFGPTNATAAPTRSSSIRWVCSWRAGFRYTF